MKKTLVIFIALLLSSTVFSQNELACDNMNYKDEVQTVLFYLDGDQLQEPIVPLSNMLNRLTLTFDILGSEATVLNYTFIHCTHDWRPTDLQRINYASGFDSDIIDDYAFSVNTLVDYVNYHLVFPNQDMKPLVSGNYLLVVYGDDMSPQNIYFTRRFMVLDERASVGAFIPRYANDLELSDTHQQLNIKASMPNLMAANIQQYSNLTIRQNGRWDNAVIGLKPTFVYPDYISYENDPRAVFEGINQFRRFNTSNFYYQSENIARITQENDYYVIDLYANESRIGKPYVSYEDIHGEKVVYIENQEKETATEADYAWVNFSLVWNAPLTHDDMYLMGALNDWNFNDKNKMWYDYESGSYQCSLLLKQGYYNYLYATVAKNGVEASTALTAGDFWETNNVYYLYFYYYNSLKGYDELIGYTTVNSH
jgi:hypothetical protein